MKEREFWCELYVDGLNACEIHFNSLEEMETALEDSVVWGSEHGDTCMYAFIGQDGRWLHYETDKDGHIIYSYTNNMDEDDPVYMALFNEYYEAKIGSKYKKNPCEMTPEEFEAFANEQPFDLVFAYMYDVAHSPSVNAKKLLQEQILPLFRTELIGASDYPEYKYQVLQYFTFNRDVSSVECYTDNLNTDIANVKNCLDIIADHDHDWVELDLTELGASEIELQKAWQDYIEQPDPERKMTKEDLTEYIDKPVKEMINKILTDFKVSYTGNIDDYDNIILGVTDWIKRDIIREFKLLED